MVELLGESSRIAVGAPMNISTCFMRGYVGDGLLVIRGVEYPQKVVVGIVVQQSRAAAAGSQKEGRIRDESEL
jgi:hypothetical protein